MSEEQNIPQMRETIERLSKDKATLSEENGNLKGELRGRDAQDAFREQGYNPANGKLYAAMNPDGEITAESVVTFATEQGLSPVGDSQEAPNDAGGSSDSADDGSSELSGMSGGSSRGGDGGAGGAEVETLTRDEWRQLKTSDPAAAAQAVASGRVEISRDNVFAGGSGLPAGTNPYATFGSDPE